ncbi:carbohydrate ABC transporter permease [Acutalibacter caecimuris]|uniref:carbohydrate ABC transporter permease n=1 Tax=Acutalibacter caecimuris TaxID=3093657 RepID=UPI002AC9BBD5|nr:carbohydrate ABC transporter permease [Acutalibacter sp. M00118]
MIVKNKAFNLAAHLFVGFLIVICIVPFWLLIISSFTSEAELLRNGYSLIPQKLSFVTYEFLWTMKDGVLRAYLMSVIISVTGVASNVVLTTLFAYPLSRRDLPGRGAISIFLFVTMLFNGGLVPTYLIYTQVFHIKDTLAGMIIPGLLMNAFHIIMMRTYINSNISDEIMESARIDGAGEFRCLWSVVLPLSKPILGTLALMTFIAYWNNWTNGIYYIQQRTELYGIQNYLKRIMDTATTMQQQMSQGYNVDPTTVPTVGIRMALAVVAVVPVLLIYPFFQKSFVKGITLGSVKG